MKNIYKIFVLFSFVLLFAGTASGQNVIQGGDMESEEHWTIYNLFDDDAGYEFGYTDETPAFGDGGALRVYNIAEFANILFFQEVTLINGETYIFNGAFKDLGPDLSNFWNEAVIKYGVTPVPREDWAAEWDYSGFNTWDGCGPGVDGTYLDDGCLGDGTNLYTVDVEGYGEGDEVDMYFGVKLGTWEGQFNVLLDEFTLVPEGEDTSSDPVDAERPRLYSLDQNYPNPFNPVTNIRFTLPSSSHVTLEIFSITGQRIAVPVNEVRSQGRHTVSFDASNLSSGLYLYRLRADDFVQTRKMQLVK